VTSGAPTWAGDAEAGRAWASNENIEANRLQAKIEAIFDMDISFS
jgi:hypothetical protein